MTDEHFFGVFVRFFALGLFWIWNSGIWHITALW